MIFFESPRILEAILNCLFEVFFHLKEHLKQFKTASYLLFCIVAVIFLKIPFAPFEWRAAYDFPELLPKI